MKSFNILFYTPQHAMTKIPTLFFSYPHENNFRTIVALHVMNKLFITMILLHTLSTCIHTEIHIQLGCCAASIASQPIVCVLFFKTKQNR